MMIGVKYLTIDLYHS